MLQKVIVLHPVVSIEISTYPEAAGEWIIVSSKLNGASNAVASPEVAHPVAQALLQLLDRGTQDVCRLKRDESNLTDFQRAVLGTASSIPFGNVESYAGLAAKAGFPRATRAAASVMRNNPFPVFVPCHRVVRSDGKVGGFMGQQHGRGVSLKCDLLRHEGCRVTGGLVPKIARR